MSSTSIGLGNDGYTVSSSSTVTRFNSEPNSDSVVPRAVARELAASLSCSLISGSLRASDIDSET